MGMMRTLVGTPDKLEWDQLEARQGNSAAIAVVELAREKFVRHRSGGGEVLERQPSGAFKRVTDFSSDADELVLVPPVAGG